MALTSATRALDETDHRRLLKSLPMKLLDDFPPALMSAKLPYGETSGHVLDR